MADNALRDEILRLAVPRVTGDFSDVEIIAHILDAMAFMIAMLPEPLRKAMIYEVTSALPIHVEQRAVEITDALLAPGSPWSAH